MHTVDGRTNVNLGVNGNVDPYVEPSCRIIHRVCRAVGGVGAVPCVSSSSRIHTVDSPSTRYWSVLGSLPQAPHDHDNQHIFPISRGHHLPTSPAWTTTLGRGTCSRTPRGSIRMKNSPPSLSIACSPARLCACGSWATTLSTYGFFPNSQWDDEAN